MKRYEGQSRFVFRGWWKCAFLLVPPFAVLFSEVWMRTEVLRNQYVVNDLNREIRETRSRIDLLVGKTRHLERMERIHAKAPGLGFVEPEPGQIEVIEIPDPTGLSTHAKSGSPSGTLAAPGETVSTELSATEAPEFITAD